MGVVLKFGRAQARVQNTGYASEETAVVVNDIVRFFGVLWRCRFASYKNNFPEMKGVYIRMVIQQRV